MLGHAVVRKCALVLMLSAGAPVSAQEQLPTEVPSDIPVPPGRAPEAKAARPNQLRLEVETVGGGVSMRAPGDSDFSPLCVEDCERNLDPGTYQFALRRPDGSLTELLPPVDLKSNSVVEAAFQSRRAGRIVGGIILAVGVLTGAVLLGRGIALRNDAQESCDLPGGMNEACRRHASRVGRGRMIAGGLTGLGSALLGAILISRKDEQSLRVRERESFTNDEAEPREEPALAPGDPEEARALVAQHRAKIKACLQDTPATAELNVAPDGSVTKLAVLGDAELGQRDCLRQLLTQFSFPAGAPRLFSIDIQPMLQ